MINTLLTYVAKWTLGAKLVGAVSWVHKALDGKRSEINLGIMVIVYVLKYAGIIPPEAANTVWVALTPLLAATLADKVSKVRDALDKVIPPPPTPAP